MALPSLPLLSIQRLNQGLSAGPGGTAAQPLRFAIRRTASAASLEEPLTIELGLFAGPLAAAIDAPVLQPLSFTPGQELLVVEIPLLEGATAAVGAALQVWILPQEDLQLQPGGQSATGGFDSEALLHRSLPQPSPWKSDRETINPHAFAALRADGSVLAWGDPELGGDSSAVDAALSAGVVQVFSTNAAFAALKADGSVVAWGDAESGANTSAVGAALLGDVRSLSSTEAAFAALKADGSVITWGDEHYGGDSDAVAERLAAGVIAVAASERAFAALKADGSVVAWGDSAYGGNASPLAAALASGVTTLVSSASAFAALKGDGSVITWGDSVWGGDSTAVAEALTEGVTALFANGTAFSALRSDGTVISWGDSLTGGDSSAVADQLRAVDRIASNDVAFAALRTDGSVVCWGDPTAGGDSSAVAEELDSGVLAVVGSERAFAALKADGSVVCWGDLLSGGEPLIGLGPEASGLESGVVSLNASAGAFVARKADGSLLCWGHPLFGGAFSSAVGEALGADVIRVVSNGSAFAAIKADGSLVCWGDPLNGGLGPLDRLLPGADPDPVPVLTLADPFSDELLDHSPTALNLSRNLVLERIAAGTTVAWLEGLDPDPGDTLNFQLVEGDGDRDNGLFRISGRRLELQGSLDVERSAELQIRLVATDRWGRSLERAMTLHLIDAPSEERILLQGSREAEEVQLEDLTALALQDPAAALDPLDQTTLAELGIRLSLDRRAEGLGDGLKLRLPWELLTLGLRGPGSPGLSLTGSELPLLLAIDPGRGSREGFGFDPISGHGARVLDQNGDGQPDAVVLTLGDGGRGDRDGLRNDQLSMGLVLAKRSGLSPALRVQANGLTIGAIDPSAGEAPAVPLQVQVRIQQRPQALTHLGMVVLQPGESLEDLSPEQLDQRSRRLLSSLGSADPLALLDDSGCSSLTMLSDQTLLLFEEGDGAGLSRSGLGANRRWLTLRPGELDPDNADRSAPVWATGQSGLELALSLQESAWVGLADLVAAEQGWAPLLDFSALGDQVLSLTARVQREASLETSAGFYRILDRQGTVRDPVSGALLRPGEAGYGAAALAEAVQEGPLAGLQAARGQVSRREGRVQEQGLLAPYAQVSGDGTYFAFAAANPDGIEHVLTLGRNVFGFEDLRGGGDRDFNDLVISLAVQPLPVG